MKSDARRSLERLRSRPVIAYALVLAAVIGGFAALAQNVGILRNTFAPARPELIVMPEPGLDGIAPGQGIGSDSLGLSDYPQSRSPDGQSTGAAAPEIGMVPPGEGHSTDIASIQPPARLDADSTSLTLVSGTIDLISTDPPRPTGESAGELVPIFPQVRPTTLAELDSSEGDWGSETILRLPVDREGVQVGNSAARTMGVAPAPYGFCIRVINTGAVGAYITEIEFLIHFKNRAAVYFGRVPPSHTYNLDITSLPDHGLYTLSVDQFVGAGGYDRFCVKMGYADKSEEEQASWSCYHLVYQVRLRFNDGLSTRWGPRYDDYVYVSRASGE